jgi:transcriptional regulator with XRE-family HTH domain
VNALNKSGDLPSLNGEYLRKLRESRGLSQEKAAPKLGIDQTRLSRLETGEIEISEEMEQRIRESLGTLDAKTPKPSDRDDSNSLAEWVRNRREANELSTRELAEKANLTQATIQFIEAGRTESPQKSTLDSLVSVLGPLPERLKQKIHDDSLVEDLEFRGAFPIEEWKKNVDNDNPTPCVYVFYDEGQRPVRIGETEDLRRRIIEYQDDSWWFRSPTAETFAFITVRDPELRRKIEKALIKLVGERYAMFNVKDKR